jgi:hypothetical protein
VRAVEDLSAHTLRELLTLARERLGPAAVGLKTREELLAALRSVSLQSGERVGVKGDLEVVTRDFFRLRKE